MGNKVCYNVEIANKDSYIETINERGDSELLVSTILSDMKKSSGI